MVVLLPFWFQTSENFRKRVKSLPSYGYDGWILGQKHWARNVTKVLLLPATAAQVTRLRTLVLQKGGYEVLVASTPDDAARIARERSVSVAVVDCDTDDAIDCCHAIRTANRNVWLVGLGQSYVDKRLLLLLHAHVHKLDGPQQLLNTISDVLQAARS